MAEEKYHQFDEKAIQEAIAAAKSFHEEGAAATAGTAAMPKFPDNGRMEIAAQCLTLGVVNKRICLSIPIAGRVCLPISIPVPNNQVQACISLCTHLGVPTGVKVTVSANGHVLVRKSFGWC